MRTLFILSAIAFAEELGNDDLKMEFEKAVPESSVEYKVIDYKGEPTINCSSTELCDAMADLRHWHEVEDTSHYDGQWEVQDHPWLKGKKQLVMKDEMKYYGLSRPVNPWTPAADQPIAFSMTARLAENHNCGGAYVKLYTRKNADLHNLSGDTPYSIMFGPDHCGVNTRKLHLIIQYTDAAGRRVEEHLSTNIDLPTELSKTHQYAFAITPKDGGTLQIFVDGQVVQEGKLKELTKPGWKSPETIDDPTDIAPDDWQPLPRMIPEPGAVKPDDWDEEEPETIEDHDAEMPEDWLEDEPLYVPNMSATKPEGWNDEEDGDWNRPTMKNPRCQEVSGCGTWNRPIVPNPKYKGPWKAPMIPNPDYTDKYPTRQIPHPKPYDILDPYKSVEPFNSLGFEIWTVQAGTTLDNFMLSTDPAKMQSWSAQAFSQIQEIEEFNYKLSKTQNSSTDKSSVSSQDTKRYLKIASAVLVFGAVVLVSIRKLFGSHFNASDSPAAPITTVTKEKPVSATLETSETSAGALDAKKSAESETEPTVGETKPKQRPAA